METLSGLLGTSPFCRCCPLAVFGWLLPENIFKGVLSHIFTECTLESADSVSWYLTEG